MAESPPLGLQDPSLREQIAYIEEAPPRTPFFADVTRPMHPELVASLAKQGFDRLFTHQAAAYDAAMAGEDVVVVTGTNSGKTLCYNLPALQHCLTEPACRCLYLFPTKALAQDQLGRLEALAPIHVRVGTYDGDTPQSHRSGLRRLSHIVLTNPDMLHVGILPGHEHWARFFKSLRLIVIDEMHVYRGVFGSNVGNVLRRLLRLCHWHHSRPQIIACSATIGNPEELFGKLTGRHPRLIDADGSPSGKRTFIFWNPPVIGAQSRLSANLATAEILGSLTETGVRTLAFSRARISAELVLRYARRRVEKDRRIAPDKIESYRAGYTIKERRQIEQRLFRGDLLGLSATNAMELGVDVGALDAVVMNGYPGSASSFWQQAGRAGRGSRDGLAIYVAHDDPLEQFLVRQPGMLLNARNESVSANPENTQILSQHLLCAAHERPIAPSELTRFGANALNVAENLDRSGELEFRAGLFFYPSFEPPALNVNIRGSGGRLVTLYVEGNELGTMEEWRALTSAHEGAIYLHRGATYQVVELDVENGLAELVPTNADYYTQSIVQSVIESTVTFRESARGRVAIKLGGVKVTDVVTGYRRKSLDGDTVLGMEPLDLPPNTYDTVSLRFDLPELDLDGDVMAQLGGVHGMEHALLAVAPFLAGCDRADLGSAWYAAFPDTLQPAVFVFDKTPGGIGLCEKLYDDLQSWLESALKLLTTCPCDTGCPACILSARCESGNENLDKRQAIELLTALVEAQK